MAKASKTRGGKHFLGKSLHTTEEQKSYIIEDILCIDTDDYDEGYAELIMGKIRMIVGSYEGAVQSIDKAPRPANYIAELNGTKKNKDGTLKDGVRRQAFDLLQSLTSMSYWMTDEFVEEQGYDLQKFELELAGFFDIATKIVKKYEDMPSSGRPKEYAKIAIVNYLKKIFDAYNSIEEIEPEHEEYNARLMSGKEKSLFLFIRAGLALDNIPCPETDEAIKALFWNEDTPPEERKGFTPYLIMVSFFSTIFSNYIIPVL